MNNKKQQFSNETRQKAFKYYYLHGLNSKEIGKLLDISYRTIQKWQTVENWKEQKEVNIQDRQVWQLRKLGYSFNEITEKLGISRATAHNRVKRYQAKQFVKQKE